MNHPSLTIYSNTCKTKEVFCWTEESSLYCLTQGETPTHLQVLNKESDSKTQQEKS